MDSHGTIGREPQRSGSMFGGVHTVGDKPGYFILEVHPWDKMKKETKRMWHYLICHNQQIIGLFIIFCMISMMGSMVAESKSNALIYQKDCTTLLSSGVAGTVTFTSAQTSEIVDGFKNGNIKSVSVVIKAEGKEKEIQLNEDQFKIFLNHNGIVTAEQLAPGISSYKCISLIKGICINVKDLVCNGSADLVSFLGGTYNSMMG